MLRAVVDTNVWVSALLNPKGYPALVLEAFRNGTVEDVKPAVSMPLDLG
jgi:predicted nucleic acid-binding protein